MLGLAALAVSVVALTDACGVAADGSESGTQGSTGVLEFDAPGGDPSGTLVVPIR